MFVIAPVSNPLFCIEELFVIVALVFPARVKVPVFVRVPAVTSDKFVVPDVLIA